MAARDPVLVDAYVCDLLQYTPDDVPYIRMAEQLQVGTADLQQAQIITLEADQETADLGTAAEEERDNRRRRRIVELSDAVEEVESCSACYAYLIPALERLQEEGRLGQLRERICIGQGYQGKTGEIGIGRCTGAFAHSVPGCPPTEQQIYDFLDAYLKGLSTSNVKNRTDVTVKARNSYERIQNM
jgi:hypothetical protein